MAAGNLVADNTIGARVRDLRVALGEMEGEPISQERLAHRAGVALLTVHNIEAGKSAPQVATLQKIACALGVPVGTIIEGR